MTKEGGQNFDRALDGTAYWTLSLYVEAEKLKDYYPEDLITNPGDKLRSAQLAHMPSFALRNAIDPLFNDIADRDFFGKPRDFLFAAGHGKTNGPTPWTLDRATQAIRTETELVFDVPATFSWTTEGVSYNCDLKRPLRRKVRLRRFWFAHSDGALSYHLSFEHHYGGALKVGDRDVLRDPYGLQTYYFLSLLQKLAAPKEFILGPEMMERIIATKDTSAFCNPFLSDEAIGIDPLDGIKVRENGKRLSRTFWRFVRDSFVEDTKILLEDVLGSKSLPTDREIENLPKMTEVIEVPGLRLPRCRYLFHINDRRFFDRLLPLDPSSGEALERKRAVREQCFVPFRDMIDGLTRTAQGTPVQCVWLGSTRRRLPGLPWSDFDLTQTYQEWIAEGVFLDKDGNLFADEPALKRALHEGTALICYDAKDQPIDPPIPVHIPAYETGRADCLDYLFLAGFNQNIIDWLNQDTSEILDSIDPIYPVENVQADERFFIRYANHRGMITYVAGSRSLEIGNDYIGTCPYAFLIHVLAMHNEFLARDHEERSAKRIDEIDREVQALRTEPVDKGLRSRSTTLETAINDLKLDSYRKYERHRYLNIFRYDTEEMVFERLAELRGTDWRGQAMVKALDTLEEYAKDLDRRQAEALDDWQRGRDRRLGAVIGAIGLISGVGTLFSVSEFLASHPRWGWPIGPRGDEPLMSWIIGNLGWYTAMAGLVVLFVLAGRHWRDIWRALKETFVAAPSDQGETDAE